MSSDFATHEELSSYVKSNLEEMTQADMEYCICLYHLFHAFMEEEGEFSDKMCQETNLAEAIERKKTEIPVGRGQFPRARIDIVRDSMQSVCAEGFAPLQCFSLLILGAHAQRGLPYLLGSVCVSVC